MSRVWPDRDSTTDTENVMDGLLEGLVVFESWTPEQQASALDYLDTAEGMGRLHALEARRRGGTYLTAPTSQFEDDVRLAPRLAKLLAYLHDRTVSLES
jgi:hypothetical protein